MIKLILMLSLSSQCFVDQMQWASKVEILKPFSFHVSTRGANKKFLKKLYKLAEKKNDKIDSRYFALAWMESRLRPFPNLGDRGKACGIYQIHARHSFPMFRRRKGYVGWDEKEDTSKRLVRSECAKLRGVTYAVDTLSKFLRIHDKKQLPPCHHNSGVYGKCHPWYKERLDFWMLYFEASKVICDERIQKAMAMMRTGSPVPTAPTDKIQGYLDGMAGKEPQKKDDEVYMAGYELADRVKKGEEEAPSWAV